MSDYYRLDLILNPYMKDAADLLAAFLADAGFDSFEELPDGIAAYAPEGEYSEEAVDEIIASFPIPVKISKQVEKIGHKDWNEEWEKNYFKPLVLAAGRCVVHSSFHTDYPEAELDIVIDPKMAFGTGHHATTSMMVDNLFSLDLKEKSLIDMGTGTGILAIIAKKLGAGNVFGIEIDPGAYENALENMTLNQVEFNLLQGDASLLEGMPQVDVFLANINRNIILADLDRYVKTLKNNGVLLLSGFYRADIPLIEAALSRYGMKIASISEEEGDWASIKATF